MAAQLWTGTSNKVYRTKPIATTILAIVTPTLPQGVISMTHAEIIEHVKHDGLTIVDVIDAVVEYNGIIGVGLIDLQDFINDHLETTRRKKSKVSAEALLNS